MSKFQVGDKVRLDPDYNWQSFTNQDRVDLKTEGTIEGVPYESGSDTLYEIRFDGGALDRYYESKLIPVPEPKVRDEWAETFSYLHGRLESLNAQYEKADAESNAARNRAGEIWARREDVILQLSILEDA